MENYGKAKAKIFENQDESQYLIINYDDKDCFALSKDCRAHVIPFSRKEELKLGAFVKDGVITIRNEKGEEISFCRADQLMIPGSHNLENALAATAISYFAGVEPDVITKALVEFQGVEHRIEFCGQVDGVRFVNDSKGTNIDSTCFAIDAYEDAVLICGGKEKGLPLDELVEKIREKIKMMRV